MKTLILLIALSSWYNLSIGQVNFCNYFGLNVEKSEYNGKSAIYISPQTKAIEGDTFSNFISNHQNRFDYIIFNKIDSLSKYSKYFPDTIKIEKEFCDYLSTNERLNNYFKILSNKNITKIKFDKDEMMKIAARFFLCDKVNEQDTTIGYHICIGINGQKELQSNKDYSVLEAFCFEAIFNYINNNETPEFVSNFRSYIKRSSDLHKSNFISKNQFLEKVKNDCFHFMEKDLILKESLLNFYNSNRHNLGFTIE